MQLPVLNLHKSGFSSILVHISWRISHKNSRVEKGGLAIADGLDSAVKYGGYWVPYNFVLKSTSLPLTSTNWIQSKSYLCTWGTWCTTKNVFFRQLVFSCKCQHVCDYRQEWNKHFCYNRHMAKQSQLTAVLPGLFRVPQHKNGWHSQITQWTLVL